LGRERTYGVDLSTDVALREALQNIIDSVWQRIENSDVAGRTVTLKLKYEDFRQITRSSSCDQYIGNKEQFAAIASELLAQVLPVTLGVRLLGLTLSGLGAAELSRLTKPDSQRVGVQRTFEF
jgi:DNA polymerase-4